MTTIGHNNPPALEAMSLHIEDLFKLVSDTTEGATVTTDEQEAALDALLKDVRTARKDADAKRAEEKQPHLTAAKAVDEAWKPLIARCDMGMEEIKSLLTPYRTAKLAAKEEAARKAREEAEAKEAAAREALKQSENIEARFEAEEQLKQASKLKAVANKADRAPTGLRPVKVATVTDYKAALLWIAKNDKAALDDFVEDYARRNAPTHRMDGVEVAIERRAA